MVLDFRDNSELKNCYLYDNRVLFNNDDYYEKDKEAWVSKDINFFNKVPVMIMDLLNFDNNYLSMKVIKIPVK